MMTTTAAFLGAPALCFCFGEGSEPRQPLGVPTVGGQIFGQAPTLYTMSNCLSASESPAIAYLARGACGSAVTLRWRKYVHIRLFKP